MNLEAALHAILLGIIEGLTECLPVSSTGHLILAIDILGFQAPAGNIFETVIQFGAILAVCWLYRQRLIHAGLNFHREQKSFVFVRNITLAFVPTVVFGVLFHSQIKEALFSPVVVSANLVIGGILILIIERIKPKHKIKTVESISVKNAILVGLFQSIAMIPGVSRSGATIMGAMMLGVDRKTATEFSFLLAIPTILAATVYDLYKNIDSLTTDSVSVIGLGFIAAFISASFVIKWFIHFISTHSFDVFGWYRITIGSVMLFLLLAAA